METAFDTPSVEGQVHRFRFRRLGTVGIAFLAVALLIMLFIPARRGRITTRVDQCRSNLHLIGLALRNYESDWKSLPPVCVTDVAGNRLYSWRVPLLPYLDKAPVYNSTELDKGWDHPANALTRAQHFVALLCPSDLDRVPGETNYVAVTGPGTRWADGGIAENSRLASVRPPILVIEMANSGIHWMEPRDIDLEQLLIELGRPSANEEWLPHRKKVGFWSKTDDSVVNVLLEDGTVESLTLEELIDTVREMRQASFSLRSPGGG